MCVCYLVIVCVCVIVKSMKMYVVRSTICVGVSCGCLTVFLAAYSQG